MYLETLVMRNFRNYTEEERTFHPETNMIYGGNAEGKSNLLEAIGYLSMGISFRDAADAQLIRWQQPFFYLQGEVITNRQKTLISASYEEKKKKIWKIDGQIKKRLSEVLGHFYTVYFSPDDLQLVKASPHLRRQFLDREMVQLNPPFCQTLNHYQKTLQQRNFLLAGPDAPDPDMLACYEGPLTELAGEIYWQRSRLLKRLTPKVQQMQAHLSGAKENLSLHYESFLPEAELMAMNKEEIATAFGQELQRIRPQELRRGMTLLGPQRDDLLIFINGKSAKQFASQGQMRTAALALKLSELALIEEETGEYPALLLDDVMSELDTKRREQLLTLLDGKVQTLITATDINVKLTKGKKFFIQSGHIIEP